MSLLLLLNGRETTVPAFSPADISGLVAWYDASDTSTITQSGGAVSQWNDKSGNGYHLTQGTSSAQPTTGTNTINGLNAIGFTRSTTKWMDFPSGVYSIPNGNNTSIVVFTTPTIVDTYQNILSMTDGVNSRYRLSVNATGTSELGDINAANSTTGVSASLIPPVTVATPHVGIVRREGADCNVFYDGAKSSAAVASSFTAISARLCNFAGNPATGSGFPGNIGLVLIYSGALSTSDMNKLGAFVEATWGVTWTTVT